MQCQAAFLWSVCLCPPSCDEKCLLLISGRQGFTHTVIYFICLALIMQPESKGSGGESVFRVLFPRGCHRPALCSQSAVQPCQVCCQHLLTPGGTGRLSAVCLSCSHRHILLSGTLCSLWMLHWELLVSEIVSAGGNVVLRWGCMYIFRNCTDRLAEWMLPPQFAKQSLEDEN